MARRRTHAVRTVRPARRHPLRVPGRARHSHPRYCRRPGLSSRCRASTSDRRAGPTPAARANARPALSRANRVSTPLSGPAWRSTACRSGPGCRRVAISTRPRCRCGPPKGCWGEARGRATWGGEAVVDAGLATRVETAEPQQGWVVHRDRRRDVRVVGHAQPHGDVIASCRQTRLRAGAGGRALPARRGRVAQAACAYTRGRHPVSSPRSPCSPARRAPSRSSPCSR